MPNRTDGIKSPMQTWVDYFVYEGGFTIPEIAASRAAMRRRINQDLEDKQGRKVEAIAVATVGALTGIACIPVGLVPLAVAGAIVGAAGGLKLMERGRHQLFAERESMFLRTNAIVLDILAEIAGQGIAPNEMLADIYNELFAESCVGEADILKVDAAQIQRKLAESANNCTTGFGAAQHYATAMSQGTVMEASPIPAPVQPQQPEPEPIPPPTAFRPQFMEVQQPLKSAEPVNPWLTKAAIEAAPISTTLKPADKAGLLSRLISIEGGFIPSRLVVGASRSGKSQLVSDALSVARQKYGEKMTVFYISAGYKKNEDGCYWRGVNHEAGYYFLRMSPEEIEQAYQHWINVIEAFDAAPFTQAAPKLLVVDEINTIMKFGENSETGQRLAQMVRSRLQLGASLGSKDGYCIWAISPVGGMGSLNLTRDEVSALNPVFVAVSGDSWNDTMYTTARGNGLAPKQPPSGFRNGSRVVGIGGSWEELPVSGQVAKSLDRDYRTLAAERAVKVAAGFAVEPAPNVVAAVARMATERLKLSGETNALEVAQQYRDIGQTRQAMSVLIGSIANSKTAFCSALGIEDGNQLKTLGEVYDWAIGTRGNK